MMTETFNNRMNEVVKQFNGLIVYVTVNRANNKVIIHMNHSIKTYKSHVDTIKRVVTVVAKECGYSSFRICIE